MAAGVLHGEEEAHNWEWGMGSIWLAGAGMFVLEVSCSGLVIELEVKLLN
jgi:hypothetical protein